MRDFSELRRTLPCPLLYARAAALDMVESVSGDASVRREDWLLTGTVTIYGNKSYIAMEVTEKDENHSMLRLKMLEPDPRLSMEGQHRALVFLADGMEQLLENNFAKINRKEIML